MYVANHINFKIAIRSINLHNYIAGHKDPYMHVPIQNLFSHNLIIHANDKWLATYIYSKLLYI